MATSLPKAPLSIATDEPAKQEYFNALTNAVEALENRQGVNMWNVAGAFLDPGRTGSFGESIGRVGTVVGADQEKQKALELPIAQLRAQLAGQKYELANQAEGLKMLGNVLGMTPEATSQSLQTGQFPGGLTNKVKPELYAAFAARYPKLGEVLKNVADMENNRIKNIIELLGKNVSVAEIKAKYGPGFMDLLPPDMRQLLDAREKQETGTTMPGTTLTPDSSAVMSPTPNQPTNVDLTARSRSSEMPLAVQAKGIEERQKLSDEEWKDTRNVINSWTTDRVNSSVRDLRELHDLADKYPQVWGLMQKQGLLSALAAAAEKGVSTPWGSFSAPVQEFISKLNLKPEEQRALARGSMIIARQFFENARVNKSVLGPQISNADVTLLQAPMVSPKDSAEAIKYYAKESVLGMKMRGEYFSGMRTWDRQTNMKEPFGNFFNSPIYEDISRRYNDLFNQLYEKHYPSFR